MQNNINRAGWLVAGVLALFVAAALTGVVSGGPLDPPAAPSSTGTLPQVEPRSPIPPVGWNGTFPIVISQPGSYFLTGNLTGIGFSHGIQIGVSNVTLDLSGFTMTGGSTAGGIGIYSAATYDNITIRNGTVTGWASGIGLAQINRAVVDDIRAYGNGGDGINVGSSSIIRDCVAQNNSNEGIEAGPFAIVTGCAVSMIGAPSPSGTGIQVGEGSLVERNTVKGTQNGISTGDASTIQNNVVRSIGVTGIKVTSDSTVIGNLSTLSTTSAIWITGAGNRIEGNTATDSLVGINNGISAANLIVRNVASGNGSEYLGTVGTVVTSPVGAEAWANFDY